MPPTIHLPAVRGETDTPTRFTASAQATDSAVTPNGAFRAWFAEQCRVNRFAVNRIDFADLVGWGFDPDTGDLGHASGRFFTVEGLHVDTERAQGPWMQPIISQPEIGVLGILVKEFDGVLHCLMQAKMEPGNINTIQLSPTVQATRSNYTGVHRGRPIRLLEYFTQPHRGRVLVDALQSEQGSWFLRKRNRNMVVEVTDDIPEHEDFRWLTMGQLHELLGLDNVVNMDARTVLACVPFAAADGGRRCVGDRVYQDGAYRDGLLRSVSGRGPARHGADEIRSWLTDVRSRRALRQQSVPLSKVDGWYVHADQIGHQDGKYFTVIAVDVAASNREVARWTQPLLAPVGQGRVAFVVRPVDGVLHVLVHARTEAGGAEVAELAPTVQCLPASYADLPPERRPRYLDLVVRADPTTVRYDAVQSEEGGRFHHADNRYQIVEVGEDFPLDVPPDFRWLTVRQLVELLAHSNYLNIQARSLLAALQTTW